MKEITLRNIIHRLIKRKWLVLVPVVIGLSLSAAYTRNVKTYRSDAIISFNTNYLMDTKDFGFENKIRALVFSLRYGENLESIAEKAYPNIDPVQSPVEFSNKMQRLGSGGGIQLSFRRDNYRALGISFESTQPEEAYRVVDATLKTIIEQNSASTKRRFDTSVQFMEKEIEGYRSTLREIEKELFTLGGETSELDKDPLLSEVRSSIVQKLQDVQVLTAQGYGQEHPKRKMIEVELQGFRNLEQQRLEELSRNDSNSTSLSDTQLDTSNSTRNARVVELKREREGIMSAYVSTVQELEYIKRRGKVETTNDVGLEIIVEEPARIPKAPVPFAGLSFVVMTGLVSLALGVGLFALSEMLDTSVHSISQLEAVSELPVLGAIETINDRSESKWNRRREFLITASLIAVVVFSNHIINSII